MPDSPPALWVGGDLGLDVVVEPQGEVRWGDDAPASVSLLPGGQGANVAVWARRAGAAVRLFTHLGDDALARHLARAARRAGVAVRARHSGTSTRVVSLVEGQGARRTLFAHLGDGAWADLPARRPGGRLALYVSGYALVRPGGRAWVEGARAWARRHAVPIAVTPSAVSVLERAGLEAWAALAQGAWAVVLNGAEATAVTGAADPAAACRRLARSHDIVLVTLGRAGARLGTGGRVIPVPAAALATAPRDTTGAGDAAAGTFLARLLLGDGPDEAAAAAMAAAALAISQPGAWPQA